MDVKSVCNFNVTEKFYDTFENELKEAKILENLKTNKDINKPIESFLDGLIVSKDIFDFLIKIPIISSMVNFFGFINKIQDRIYLRKTLDFLLAFSQGIAWKNPKLNKFKEKLFNDEQERVKAVNYILLLLNNCDDFEKIRINAILFNEYLQGNIKDFEEYKVLSSLINKVDINSLIFLFKYYIDSQSDYSEYKNKDFINIHKANYIAINQLEAAGYLRLKERRYDINDEPRIVDVSFNKYSDMIFHLALKKYDWNGRKSF